MKIKNTHTGIGNINVNSKTTSNNTALEIDTLDSNASQTNISGVEGQVNINGHNFTGSNYTINSNGEIFMLICQT